jgi:hypothetical protein
MYVEQSGFGLIGQEHRARGSLQPTLAIATTVNHDRVAEMRAFLKPNPTSWRDRMMSLDLIQRRLKTRGPQSGTTLCPLLASSSFFFGFSVCVGWFRQSPVLSE